MAPITDTLWYLINLAPMPVGVVTAFFAFYIGSFVYSLFFSPLAQIPGPLICRWTPLWTYYHSYVGDECTRIDDLHKRYGPVVRIAPNEVVIADGAALAPIYNEKGGFKKADCYANFDIEGHATIFSTRDAEYRSKRSKAVLPMFSMNNIRSEQQVIEDCVSRFIRRTKLERDEAKKDGNVVNMLNLTRSLALDAATSYLFGLPYGGIDEKSERLSASGYVDVLVAVGRFFFMPNWLFLALEMTRSRLFPSKEEAESDKKVVNFAREAMHTNEKDSSTYQGRLAKAGISEHEIEVQMKDLMFAGTDSTGTNLSTLCWWLAKKPEVYKTLRKEISEAPADANPQSLRYLDAVVREGLRVSMANPTRLPRIVPLGGWTFQASNGRSYFIPEDTLVGCQLYTLHFNPAVFVDPFAFKPERWLDATPEMQRDAIAFGLGQRQCIARNLAQTELLLAVRAIAREGLLEGATAVGEKIEMFEWFNSKIKGERIDLRWS